MFIELLHLGPLFLIAGILLLGASRGFGFQYVSSLLKKQNGFLADLALIFLSVIGIASGATAHDLGLVHYVIDPCLIYCMVITGAAVSIARKAKLATVSSK